MSLRSIESKILGINQVRELTMLFFRNATKALFLLACAIGIVNVAMSDTKITVPLRFHIVSDLPMQKHGQLMTSWVTSDDIAKVIVPEVNRIWRQADISFSIEKIILSSTLNPPDRMRLIDGIVKSRRDKSGKSDPERIRNLNKLINWKDHDESVVNIYLVPYLGEKSQGNARRKIKRVFVGQWSDKHIKSASKPEKFQLREAGDFRRGSLSRTIAHELGHILGLRHPDKKTQTEFGLLMGGKKVGYRLTQQEITMARQKAHRLQNSQ